MSAKHDEDVVSRRDFLFLGAGAWAAVGGAAAIWPFVDQMNPDASTKALSSIEVDITPVQVGQAITVLWRGKPVFIRHRTAEEIAAAEKDDETSMRDPQKDADRVQKKEWLILIGVCTHLGCVPGGQKPSDARGDFGGWFCPCHGSHYDTAGRIRKGPAPLNLPVPEYTFLSDNRIKIG